MIRFSWQTKKLGDLEQELGGITSKDIGYERSSKSKKEGYYLYIKGDEVGAKLLPSQAEIDLPTEGVLSERDKRIEKVIEKEYKHRFVPIWSTVGIGIGFGYFWTVAFTQPFDIYFSLITTPLITVSSILLGGKIDDLRNRYWKKSEII